MKGPYKNREVNCLLLIQPSNLTSCGNMPQVGKPLLKGQQLLKLKRTRKLMEYLCIKHVFRISSEHISSDKLLEKLI